ncbi:MAG: cell division protein FtsZ [Lachnospiraceae bacterium]|nr:cell division protein FtsZ [Lachnospiraceae bacterium]
MLEVNDAEASVIVKIKVMGVGGAGNNAVNRMIDEGIAGVEYYGVNCDKQALLNTKAIPLQIGEKTTQGFGAGADPEIGRQAAEESIDEIHEALQGADMVFITCGMGGGTGTGAAPVVAKAAKEMGCLVVAVVTKPFSYEGDFRMQNAINGIEALRPNVDSIVIIPNDKILEIADRRMTKKDGFKKADEILQQIVQNITGVINTAMEVNIDFADVKRVMCNAGVAYVGTGFGSGDEKGADAVKQAVDNKLLETNIEHAQRVLLTVTHAPDDYTMYDEQSINEYIISLTGRNVNLIIGTKEVDDPDMKESCRVTLIATGIDEPMSHSGGRMVNPGNYRQGGGRPMGQGNVSQMPNRMQGGARMPVSPYQAGAGVPQGTGSIFQGQQGAADGQQGAPVSPVTTGTSGLPRYTGGFNSSAPTGTIRTTKPKEQYVIPKFIRTNRQEDEDE